MLVRDDGADDGVRRWALELPDPSAPPARKPGAKGPARGAKAPRKQPAKAVSGADAAGVETVRRLSFTLDEVERARLVPKVKF